MTSPVFLWTFAAVLLFWAVGAYNRLMRLRADAKTAFDALEVEFSRQIELVRRELPPPEVTQPAPLEAEPVSFWSGLHGAANQFAASLAAARIKPLHPEGIAALGSAQEVLVMAWERAEREDAHDLAGPRLPDTVLRKRAQLALQSHAATEQFNVAVSRYNAAIVQFPALLLAWAFGFKPAGGLASAASPSFG
jgi:LemA protein